MRKSLLFLTLLTLGSTALSQAQKPRHGKQENLTDTTNKNTDSTLLNEFKGNEADNIPSITLSESDIAEGSSQSNTSQLSAGRDPFFSHASFNFYTARFRHRGYENNTNSVYINGLPTEGLDNGFAPTGLWGGLNNVMRNRDIEVGLRPNSFSFGEIGSTTNIDMRASKERRQTQVEYSFSNGAYQHRVGFSHATGMMKNGWGFAFAGNFRGSDESYLPGTYINSYSFYAAVDKKINEKQLLSLVVFGAPTELGREAASVQEIKNLAGDKYYNPSWGYQNGKKRNADYLKTTEPYLILSHDFKIGTHSSLVSAIGGSYGDKKSGLLDWYNAADPRPDYYKNLPSAFTDPAESLAVANQFRTDVNTRQINWDRLIDDNRHNVETEYNVNGTPGNNVTGIRSEYVLLENVTRSTRGAFNTVFNTKFSNNIDFTAGASYQLQKNEYFQKLNDLLGGQFYVDINQFAQRDFPSNPAASYNNILQPNRLVHEGDKLGYDYDIDISKVQAWSQAMLKLKKVDVFGAINLSNTQFYRDGHTENGLFTNTNPAGHSYGKSTVYTFNNIGVKGGATYKVDGRNYLYLNGEFLTQAPVFQNIYISPRTRDNVQNNIESERISSVEGGYILHSPTVTARATGYYTEINNAKKVLTFYDDDYRTLVNYALTGIDKVHYGFELGSEIKVVKNVVVNAVASVGRYYYNSRQFATVIQDNSSTVLDTATIYSKNYRVGNTPQEAYSLGVEYRSPHYWYVGVTANYFDQIWIDINPILRSYSAVEGLTNDKTRRDNILKQTQYNSQSISNFYAGFSKKAPKSWGLKKRAYYGINLRVDNIFNTQNLVTGAYEQLRYDFIGKTTDKYPPKLFYAWGTTFAINAFIRFN